MVVNKAHDEQTNENNVKIEKKSYFYNSIINNKRRMYDEETRLNN